MVVTLFGVHHSTLGGLGGTPKSLHCVVTSIPWQLALKFVLNVKTYKHTKLSPVALYTHAELRHKLLQLLSYSKNVSNGIVPTLAAEGIWSTCMFLPLNL